MMLLWDESKAMPADIGFSQVVDPIGNESLSAHVITFSCIELLILACLQKQIQGFISVL